MDKCEGCPFDVFIYPENCCATGDATEPLPDCHLTPDHKRIIDAMIRGVFDCGHCGKKTEYRPEEYVLCPRTDQYAVLNGFCHHWQERKEGEDGRTRT